MTAQAFPIRQEFVRPAARAKQQQAPQRRSVAGPLKALIGPRNLPQALNRAVSPRRRRASAEQSGYDGQAQQLSVAPYLRALVVRQLVGGSLHDLPHGMAHDPLYDVPGARLEISVPALSKAKAQRPVHAVWDVVAEVRARIAARPQPARMGREPALGSGHAQGVAGNWPTPGVDPDFCCDHADLTAPACPVGAHAHQAGAGRDQSATAAAGGRLTRPFARTAVTW